MNAEHQNHVIALANQIHGLRQELRSLHTAKAEASSDTADVAIVRGTSIASQLSTLRCKAAAMSAVQRVIEQAILDVEGELDQLTIGREIP